MNRICHPIGWTHAQGDPNKGPPHGPSATHAWHVVLAIAWTFISLSASADSWLQFDGSDDRVMVPYSDSFPTEVFTVGAWINSESITQRSAIIARGEDDNSFNLSWQLYVAGDGTLEIMLEDSRENNFCYPRTCMGAPQPSCSGDPVTIADGGWHHVAATRDGAGTLVLYVDGEPLISCSATGVPSSNNFHDLSIGSTFGSIGPLPPGGVEPPIWFFNGLIDEPFIWNVALDGQQMEQIYVNGVDPDSAALVGYWEFEEGAGQMVTDGSAAGNHGYLGALVEQDSADPVWQGDPGGECDIGFHNGIILTMAPLDTVASSLEIVDGKISVIDAPVRGACAQQIDLQGRVLIPGLIDNHVHWFDRAGRPGNNVAQMDNAFSCQDTIDILNREILVRSIPVVSGSATADNFVTAIGGITSTQFAAEDDAANLTSAGLPSRQCLDSVERPVFISAGFGGPSTANSAAENYFESRGISVAVDGAISNDSAARDSLAAEHSTDDAGGNEVDRINAYWYVYLNGAPVWLVGTGPISQDRADLEMFITSGPDFPPNYDAAALTVTPWGNLTFDFTSDTRAVASWSSTVAGFSGGSMEISQLAVLSSRANGCHGGSYYNANQNGHGLVAEVVTVSGVESLVLSWYVYLDGQQVWLFGQGPINDGAATVTLERFSGADFPPGFVADDVLRQHWGTMALQFTADAVTVSWDSDDPAFADGDMVMIRLTELAGHACQ